MLPSLQRLISYVKHWRRRRNRKNEQRARTKNCNAR